jgi:hypothetical protein
MLVCEQVHTSMRCLRVVSQGQYVTTGRPSLSMPTRPPLLSRVNWITWT